MVKQPYCPVDEASRAWLDYRWSWLCQQFGINGLREQEIILPTSEFFPDVYHGKPEDVEALVDRVAKYMGIDPSSIDIRYYEDQFSAGNYSQNADGTYSIGLEIRSLRNPGVVIATIAHQLGHVLLQGQNRIPEDTQDGEQLTDLITVFFGMGILCANSVLRESYLTSGHGSAWSMSRLGYLSMNEFGYALALLADSRGESDPAWIRKLRLDVRRACRQSMRVFAHLDSDTANSTPVPYPTEHSEAPEVKLPETPLIEFDETKMECSYCGKEMEETDIESEQFKNRLCEQCWESIEQGDAEPESPLVQKLERINNAFAFWLMIIIVLILVIGFIVKWMS